MVEVKCVTDATDATDVANVCDDDSDCVVDGDGDGDNTESYISREMKGENEQISEYDTKDMFLLGTTLTYSDSNSKALK